MKGERSLTGSYNSLLVDDVLVHVKFYRSRASMNMRLLDRLIDLDKTIAPRILHLGVSLFEPEPHVQISAVTGSLSLTESRFIQGSLSLSKHWNFGTLDRTLQHYQILSSI